MEETKGSPNNGGPSYLAICSDFLQKLLWFCHSWGFELGMLIRLLLGENENSASHAAPRIPRLVDWDGS